MIQIKQKETKFNFGEENSLVRNDLRFFIDNVKKRKKNNFMWKNTNYSISNTAQYRCGNNRIHRSTIHIEKREKKSFGPTIIHRKYTSKSVGFLYFVHLPVPTSSFRSNKSQTRTHTLTFDSKSNAIKHFNHHQFIFFLFKINNKPQIGNQKKNLDEKKISMKTKGRGESEMCTQQYSTQVKKQPQIYKSKTNN